MLYKGHLYDKARNFLLHDSYKSDLSIFGTINKVRKVVKLYIFCGEKPLIVPSFDITVFKTFRRKSAFTLSKGVLITSWTIKIS